MKSMVLEKFDTDELKDVINFVNGFKDEEHIHFFLDSGGGETSVGEALIDYINSSPSKFSISLMSASSAAFVLLISVHCNITILKNSHAMAHKGSWKIEMRDGFQLLGELSEFQKNYLSTIEAPEIPLLTEEEVKIYNSGRDVYLGYERLNEIMKDLGRSYDSKKNYYHKD